MKFNVNFSKYVDNNDPLSQSPDYIIEKYNHWIGFEPTVEHKLYTPTWSEWHDYIVTTFKPNKISLREDKLKVLGI